MGAAFFRGEGETVIANFEMDGFLQLRHKLRQK